MFGLKLELGEIRLLGRTLLFNNEKAISFEQLLVVVCLPTTTVDIICIGRNTCSRDDVIFNDFQCTCVLALVVPLPVHVKTFPLRIVQRPLLLLLQILCTR